MSSGGMDWAYRMIAAHTFDGMEIAVVLHLGWRDHPDFRSDRGIARALQKDRKNISRVTAKLAERGVIVRRSGQWVACETVAIVEEKAGALRPAEPDEKPGRGHQDPGVIRTPQEGSSGPRKRGHQDPAKRRENLRKGETRFRTSQNAPVARPMGGGSGLASVSDEKRPSDPWARAASAAAVGMNWVHPETKEWRKAADFRKDALKSGVA